MLHVGTGQRAHVSPGAMAFAHVAVAADHGHLAGTAQAAERRLDLVRFRCYGAFMHQGLHNCLRVLPLVLGLGAAGCGIRFTTTLDPATAAGVKSTQATSFVPQGKLRGLSRVYVGGGILINLDPIQAGVKDAAWKVWAASKYVDFRSEFWAAILPAVKETPWLRAVEPRTSIAPLEPITATMVSGAAVLTLSTAYFLSQNRQVIIVSTELRFYLQGQPETVAAGNSLRYYSAEIGPQLGNEAIPLWIADEGAAYRRAVAESAVESAKMVRYALRSMGGDPPVPVRKATIKVQLRYAAQGFGEQTGKETMPGSILEETTSRILFQNSRGFLFSFPAEGVEVVDTAHCPPAMTPAEARRTGCKAQK